MNNNSYVTKRWICGVSFVTLFGFSGLAGAVERDNSKVNDKDQSIFQKTAEDQSANSKDVSLSAKIRREITKDESLSTYGKNIKIIAESGMVTLRGPVRSQAEINKIERVASRIAGRTNVVNQMEVVPAE